MLLAVMGVLCGSVARGQLIVTTVPTNPTCQYNNGSFIVNVTGGTPPYQYLSYAAQQGNTNGIFTDLAAGTYDIHVFDAAGLQTTASIVLTNTNSPATYSWATVNPSGCNTNDGQITLTPIGGIPPYQYSIDNGLTFQSSNVFGNLGPGGVWFFVQDGNSCISAPLVWYGYFVCRL